MMRKTTPLAQRLWSRVVKGDGCWEWQGATTRGYGVMGAGRRGDGVVTAHRMAWTLTYGDPGDLCVLHRCDNPRCVNPEHLFLGTRDDNNKDAARKGRMARGSARSSLDEADVIAIRASQDDARTVAARYGISHWSVYNIRSRRVWKHVA